MVQLHETSFHWPREPMTPSSSNSSIQSSPPEAAVPLSFGSSWAQLEKAPPTGLPLRPPLQKGVPSPQNQEPSFTTSVPPMKGPAWFPPLYGRSAIFTTAVTTAAFSAADSSQARCIICWAQTSIAVVTSLVLAQYM